MKTWEKLALWFLLTWAWCGCGYALKQDKHQEAAVAAGRVAATEQEPSTKEQYAPATFPGQPLPDRLIAREVKGAKRTALEDWQKESMGADEHVGVQANVGPKGLASLVGWLVLGGGGLGAVGFVLFKLKKWKFPWVP